MSDRTCSVAGCDRDVAARGWCTLHYGRWKKHGDPLVTKTAWSRNGPLCAVVECTRGAVRRGWCDPHYRRWKQYGDPRTGGPIRPVTRKSVSCSVTGCDRRRRCYGLCGMHYQRMQKTGSLDPPKRNGNCGVPDCIRREVKRSALCATHLRRKETWGSTDAPPKKMLSKCAVDECELLARGAWGWCVRHYGRYRATGDPLKTSAEVQVEQELQSGYRVCTKCKARHPLERFKRNSSSLNGRIRECDSCCSARSAARYRAALANDPSDIPRRSRTTYLRNKYGITQEQYDAMVVAQDGECRTCHIRGVPLVIDHDHDTGTVRALLCNDCNLALGHVNESVEVLHNLIRYVQSHHTRSVG